MQRGTCLVMFRFVCILAVAALAQAEESLVLDSVTIAPAALHVKLETQVGRPYDLAAVSRDVRYLWSLGRFDDVRAELDGASVRFVTRPRLRYSLHEVRFSPHSYGFQPKLTEGSLIDDPGAREIVADMEKQLRLQGYRSAHVSYTFTPVARHEVELRLKIDAGDAVEVKHLQLDGDLQLKPKEVNRAIAILRSRRIIPGLWSLRPDYSPEAVDAAVARLRSLYLSHGFFDAQVSSDDVETRGAGATVRIHVQAGPRFRVRGAELRQVCPCLLAQRREAERRGILDFTPTLHVERERDGTVADLNTTVELGHPFYIRRIELFGLHRYSDAAVRRNLLLDEGMPLDQYLLRKSAARLMQTKLFEGIQSRDIVIRRDESSHVADLQVRLTERKFGSWSLSGPVGPASIAGPVRAAISTRLPWWSTYIASVGMVAWQQPLIPALAVRKFFPIFSLTRSFLPGDSWRSGFAVIPQVGWQGSLIATGSAQMQGRLLPILTPNRGLTPELAVAVEGDANGVIFCDPPKPKLAPLRTVGAFAVRLPGAIAGF